MFNREQRGGRRAYLQTLPISFAHFFYHTSVVRATWDAPFRIIWIWPTWFHGKEAEEKRKFARHFKAQLILHKSFVEWYLSITQKKTYPETSRSENKRKLAKNEESLPQEEVPRDPSQVFESLCLLRYLRLCEFFSMADQYQKLYHPIPNDM